MAFWTRGEDLVVGWVGPFASYDEANAHVQFCEARGDADPGTVVEADSFPGDPDDLLLTPEEDRAYEYPD